jgi:hypothetical protein
MERGFPNQDEIQFVKKVDPMRDQTSNQISFKNVKIHNCQSVNADKKLVLKFIKVSRKKEEARLCSIRIFTHTMKVKNIL